MKTNDANAALLETKELYPFLLSLCS